MSPTILDGAFAVVVRKKPKLNDIVIATVDGREIIKRISKISTAKVFLTGDNESRSTDSNTYGYITIKSVLGVVIFNIHLPF